MRDEGYPSKKYTRLLTNRYNNTKRSMFEAIIAEEDDSKVEQPL